MQEVKEGYSAADVVGRDGLPVLMALLLLLYRPVYSIRHARSWRLLRVADLRGEQKASASL